MKLELTKKAFEINFSKIEEGYLYSPEVCYAKNRNEAKSKLLAQTKYESIMLCGEDEEVTYLNIPVLRCSHLDKYSFEGKELTEQEIEEKLDEIKRLSILDEILNNQHIQYCYIRKGSYYRPNSCGYTDFKHRAGVYEKSDAVSQAKSCSDIWLERIDIEEHNKMMQDEIRDLTSRLIKPLVLSEE